MGLEELSGGLGFLFEDKLAMSSTNEESIDGRTAVDGV